MCDAALWRLRSLERVARQVRRMRCGTKLGTDEGHGNLALVKKRCELSSNVKKECVFMAATTRRRGRGSSSAVREARARGLGGRARACCGGDGAERFLAQGAVESRQKQSRGESSASGGDSGGGRSQAGRAAGEEGEAAEEVEERSRSKRRSRRRREEEVGGGSMVVLLGSQAPRMPTDGTWEAWAASAAMASTGSGHTGSATAMLTASCRPRTRQGQQFNYHAKPPQREALGAASWRPRARSLAPPHHSSRALCSLAGLPALLQLVLGFMLCLCLCGRHTTATRPTTPRRTPFARPLPSRTQRPAASLPICCT